MMERKGREITHIREQIKRLDERLGARKGATKERARLGRELAALLARKYVHASQVWAVISYPESESWIETIRGIYSSPDKARTRMQFLKYKEQGTSTLFEVRGFPLHIL